MSNIRFASPEHRDFFLDMMGEARRNDCYHRAFFYVMGLIKRNAVRRTGYAVYRKGGLSG